jgi:DNA invertase Pin-like site-specific DNA recombinase
MNIGYVRLSRDEDKENYSSIESQIALIKDYGIRNNIIIDEIFIDDNFSGYTFNRPAFKKIRILLDEGKVNLILAKDLSRLGRHNAKVLLFIDEIREMNKQLILIDEGSTGYDTNKDDDDIIGIKTWYNERYVKDISHKIKSSFKIKQKNGNLIFHEFYGYKKDIHDKNKLLIDENIAEAVRLIFDLYLKGNGYRNIVKVLNEKNIPTPSIYLKQSIEAKGKTFKNLTNSKWETHMVARILKNDIYIGTLRCGKTFRNTIKGKPIKNTNENQHIFEDHHLPIISKEDFELVQEMMIKRNDSHYRGVKKYEYVFSGYLKCADCGSYMTGRLIKSGKNSMRGYDCGNFQKHGKEFCKYHGISEENLIDKFIIDLKLKKQILEDDLNSFKIKEHKEENKDKLNEFNKQLMNVKNEYKILLSQKIKDISKETNNEYKQMIEENYSELEKEKKQKIAYLNSKIKEIQEIIETNSSEKILTFLDILNHIIDTRDINKKVLLPILEYIEVNQYKSTICHFYI